MQQISLKSTEFKYVVVGAWNTVFGIAIFGALLFALKGVTGYVGVLTISMVISVLQSHFTQRKFVWSSSASYSQELVRFSSVYCAQYLLNLLLLWIAVDIWFLPVFYSQLVIAGLLILIFFFVNKKWTFRSK